MCDRWAEQYASRFLSGPARYLLRDGDQETRGACFRDLVVVMASAARLARDLSTQRTNVQMRGLRELRGVPFKVDSGLMEAHRLHKLDVEEDERYGLDGSRVMVVVHPAVVAYGTDEGENYSACKIWSAATVWLEARVADGTNEQ